MNEVTQIKKFQLYSLAVMAIVSPVVAVTTFAMNTDFAIEKQGIMLSQQFNSHEMKAELEQKAQADMNFMFEKRLTSLEVDDKARFQKIDNFLVRVSQKIDLKY